MLEFSQKAVASNHVHHDHLNIALACLYCSSENNPKLQWYSASTWEHHSPIHIKENLPIHPNDPTFFPTIFQVSLVMMPSLVLLNKIFLMRKKSENGQKLPNNFLKKGKTWKLVKLPLNVLKLKV